MKVIYYTNEKVKLPKPLKKAVKEIKKYCKNNDLKYVEPSEYEYGDNQNFELSWICWDVADPDGIALTVTFIPDTEELDYFYDLCDQEDLKKGIGHCYEMWHKFNSLKEEDDKLEGIEKGEKWA